MSLSLKIQGVSKSFGQNQVLKDINLEAKAGDIIGLIGKSGCGKSTLLKILVGYHRADSGQILINGKNISEDLLKLRRTVGYTTQENSFYEKLDVIENMRYYANLYQIPLKARDARINHLLNRVGLLKNKNTLAENISGGMKRRLDFAISLLHNPNILVLDEPTAGLDPLLIEQFWGLVHEVAREEDKIVLMSSHILSEIETYCTKTAVVSDGRIIKMLDKSEMKHLEKKFRRLLLNNE